MVFAFDKLVADQKAVNFAGIACKPTETISRGHCFLANQRNRAVSVAIVFVVLNIVSGCGFTAKPLETEETSKKNGAVTSRSRSPESAIYFTVKTNTSGIEFRHRTGSSPDRPFPAANGSGIGALDFDLDGNYDLYFATGRNFPLEEADPEAIGNRLYRSRSHWQFQDVTDAARAGHLGYSAGIGVGDFDSDGFPDIYINCVGPNRLLKNQGDGTFQVQPDSVGVNDDKWGTSAAFLDYDHDGNLDLYVCNYAIWSIANNQFCGDRKRGVRIFCNPNTVQPERHLLFHNEGDGSFREALHEAGIDSRLARGQGVVAADIDLDGLIDIYVGNDLQPNFLFLNAGNGTFRDISTESGAALDKWGNAHAGMGVDAADLNRDELPELFVSNFENEYNTLYENLGHGSFMDISEASGLAAASLPWVGWGTVLADFDSDGFKDVVVVNGHTDENMSEVGRDSVFEQPPLIWRNVGKRFEDASSLAGEYFAGRFPGRALSVVDLDNDGDFDLIIGHQDRSPALLCNDSLNASELNQRTFSMQLVGRNSARDAVGATVRIESEGCTSDHQICGGRSYLSAHDLRIIGVCRGRPTAKISIRWPSGIRTEGIELRAGNRYVIVEPHQQNEAPFVIQR